jgi:hypothetical protein
MMHETEKSDSAIVATTNAGPETSPLAVLWSGNRCDVPAGGDVAGLNGPMRRADQTRGAQQTTVR